MLNLLVSKVTPLCADFCASCAVFSAFDLRAFFALPPSVALPPSSSRVFSSALAAAFFSFFSFENASPPSPLRAAYGVVMSGFGPRGRRVGGLAFLPLSWGPALTFAFAGLWWVVKTGYRLFQAPVVLSSAIKRSKTKRGAQQPKGAHGKHVRVDASDKRTTHY